MFFLAPKAGLLGIGLSPVAVVAGGFVLGVAVGGILANADIRQRIEEFVPVKTIIDQFTDSTKCPCARCKEKRDALEAEEFENFEHDFYNRSGNTTGARRRCNSDGYSDDDDLYTTSTAIRTRLACELPSNQGSISTTANSSSVTTPSGHTSRSSISGFTSGQTTPGSYYHVHSSSTSRGEPVTPISLD